MINPENVQVIDHFVFQLLDYAYPDPVVRGYAVRCLRNGKDSVILMYLLQLAQALKHENYLQCDLVDFLLVKTDLKSFF